MLSVYQRLYLIPMKKQIIILLALLISACAKETKQDPPHPVVNNDDKVQQKDILAKLTGQDTIEYGYSLPARAAEADKIKVRTYFKSLINLLSIKPLEHQYIAGNGQSGVNIYGILPATVASTQYIVVGAHYDSVFGSPGASDNATGVAVIFGLIKHLKTVPIRKKNIIFVFFDDEESGLWGSREFAKKLIQDSLNIHSVHTVDQMGWDSDGDRAIELELPAESLKTIYQSIALKSNIPIHITATPTSDHSAFRARGFTSIGLTEEYVNGDTSPNYHSSADTYSTVNFDYLTSSTSFISKVISYILTE